MEVLETDQIPLQSHQDDSCRVETAVLGWGLDEGGGLDSEHSRAVSSGGYFLTTGIQRSLIMATKDATFKIPPHDAIAERAVFGAMLRENSTIDEVLLVLREEDFYIAANRLVFLAITALRQSNQTADAVSVADWLHTTRVDGKRMIEQVRHDYLAELWDAAPNPLSAMDYARIVRDKSVLRRLEKAGYEIAKSASDGIGPPDELVENAERSIFAIAQARFDGVVYSMTEVAQDAADQIDARASGAMPTHLLPTGWLDLDAIIGGFGKGDLAIIGSRPSVGKTAFACGLLKNVAVVERQPVFFVSLEQGRLEIANRLLCNIGSVDSQKFRKDRPSHEDFDRLADALSLLRKAPLWIDDHPNQTMLRIASNARRIKNKHDIAAVIVDYLQLVTPDNPRDPRQEQVAAVSRRMKQLARELKIPVISLCQVNRAAENRVNSRPRLSDLRESGAIEADADTVILLHRAEEDGYVIMVDVAKQRNGMTGDVELVYEKSFMRFLNMAKQGGLP